MAPRRPVKLPSPSLGHRIRRGSRKVCVRSDHGADRFLSTVVLAWLLKLMTDSASTVNPTVALGAAFTYALVLDSCFCSKASADAHEPW